MEMRNVTEVAVQMDPPLDEDRPSVQSGRAQRFQQICRWFRSIFVSSEPNTDAEFLPDADIELGIAHGPQPNFTQDPFVVYDSSAVILPIAISALLCLMVIFLVCAIIYIVVQSHGLRIRKVV